jgi:hypothetical protein
VVVAVSRLRNQVAAAVYALTRRGEQAFTGTGPSGKTFFGCHGRPSCGRAAAPGMTCVDGVNMAIAPAQTVFEKEQ